MENIESVSNDLMVNWANSGGASSAVAMSSSTAGFKNTYPCFDDVDSESELAAGPGFTMTYDCKHYG